MPKGEKQEYWIKESIKEEQLQDVYCLGKELGCGATSKVFRCVHNGTGQPWAVKIINKKVDRKVVQTEIGILLKIQHENVIRMKEMYETPTQMLLVLELVTGGELFERIVHRGHYSEKDASAAVKEMLIAVKFLHENGIIHRDLKPENLLYENLSPNAKLKIADFGLSKIISSDVTTNTVCGTPGYCAPEIVSGEKYNGSVDLWSIGVIAYILVCGYEPFYAEDEKRMYKKILKADYEFDPPYWDNITENAKDLIKKLLTKDVKSRLTAENALTHAWVKGNAAPNDHMEEAQSNIKIFNARRKFKLESMHPHLKAKEVANVEQNGCIAENSPEVQNVDGSSTVNDTAVDQTSLQLLEEVKGSNTGGEANEEIKVEGERVEGDTVEDGEGGDEANVDNSETS